MLYNKLSWFYFHNQPQISDLNHRDSEFIEDDWMNITVAETK